MYIEGRNHGLADLLSRPPEEYLNQFKEYIESAVESQEFDPRAPEGAPLCYTLSVIKAAVTGEIMTNKRKNDEGAGMFIDFEDNE